MKMSKRILSSVLAVLMVLSVWSVGFTAVAVDSTSGAAKFDEIVLETITRPVVEFTCTDVTRVAKEANSTEPGNQIVKATPSGVPELSADGAAQAYAGETPAATRVVFKTKTVGVSVTGFACSNDTVVLSSMAYDAANGEYYVDIVSGTANAGDAITFTVDYAWTDGKTYQEKCVTYVENIVTGGAYAEIQTKFLPRSGTSNYYYNYASAMTRLLGKGVYYEQPADITTSAEDPYKSYGTYNFSSSSLYTENVASGYNTSLYVDDKTNKIIGSSGTTSYETFVPGTVPAHVYLDVSVATTLADINLRLDANVGALSSRNNDDPHTALADAYVLTGSYLTDPGTTTNDTAAASVLGYTIPAKADYGVKQAEENQSFQTMTGKVTQYQNIFTNAFTGSVANIADNSSYTIINKYYSYVFAGNGRLIYSDMTSIANVPTSITFHVVDKTVLREAIDFVLNSDPTSPVIRNNQKGVNPQSWYYKSGFQAYQTSYVEALRVLNNPKALQSEIDAAAKGLKSSYNSLVLAGADYTEVNALMDQADAILDQADCYQASDIALLEEAMDMVKSGYNILYQGAVDTMASNLEKALDIDPVAANYTKVNAAILEFNNLDSSLYTKGSWAAVEAEIAKVDYTLDATQQATVDGYETAIRAAIANLEPLVADFSTLKEYVDESNAINRDYYINGPVLTDPTNNAQAAIDDNASSAWPVTRQSEVDALAEALRAAIDSLVGRSADKTKLKAAIDAEIPGELKYYNQTLLGEYYVLVDEGTKIYNEPNLTMPNDQARIDAKTAEIEAKYIELMASYALPADKDALKAAIDQTFPGNLVYYDQILLAEYNDLVAEGTLMYNDVSLNEKDQPEIDAMTEAINAKYIEVLATYFVPATKVALKAALDAEVTGDERYYDQTLLAEYKALVEEGTAMYNDKTLSENDQSKIDAKTEELKAKYIELMASYRDLGEANKTALVAAITAAEAKIATGNYADGAEMDALVAAIAAGQALVDDNMLTGDDQADIDAATAEVEASALALVLKAADFTAVEAVSEALAALKAETVDVVTYIDGVLATEAMPKYDVAAIEAIEAEIAEFMLGEYTILDNAAIAAFAAEVEADKNALVAIVYDEYLNVAIEEYENTDLAAYTVDTADAYTAAYEVAKAVDTADQVAINDALTALVEAKNALKISAFFMAKEGTTTVVDKENGIIYGLEEGIADLEGYVTYEGGVLEYEYTENGFGTGAVVNFVVNGEVKETYTIIIYGDLNGDGAIDNFDYAMLAALANGDIEVSDAVYQAADLTFDGASDTFDLALLGAVTVGAATISQVPVI